MLPIFLGIAAAAPVEVGVLVWSDTIPGQVAMKEGIEAEAARIDGTGEALQLDLQVAGDGPAGIERQVEQMKTMIAKRVDAIIVQPTDNAALSGALQAANKAGIPVVAYDQYIRDGKLAAYITSDNRQAGWMDGEYVAAQFPDEQAIKLVLVEYPHVSSTIERLDGFLDALKKSEQRFEVVGTYKGVDPASGAAAARSILREHPSRGSIDVVFTVNDGGGLAVVDALAAAGRTEIRVATVDGDPESVRNIRAGRVTVIDSAQFCGQLGRVAMRTTWDVLHGKQVPPRLLIPTFPITAETVDRYGGWSAELPGAFELPWPSRFSSWTPQNRTAPFVP